MTYAPGTSLSGLAVDLGPIPLGTVDSVGVAWHLQSMDGWDSAEVRAELQQREADHGAWASPVYFGERPITLAGTIEAPSLALLDDAMERLRAADSLTDTTLLVHESIPKQVTVRRSGKPLMQYLTPTAASYSLMVTAGDPRRYSVELQSGTTGLPSSTGGLTPPLTPPITVSATTVSGQINATNQGTIATRPIFRIDGSVSMPSIFAQYQDSTVKQLVYSENIGVGEWLTIDVDSRQATLNDTASRRRYLAAQWPEIPPGETVSFQFLSATYDPAALLTVTWRSAWM